MSDYDDTERTEEATPEKRRRAREEGQFPRARDTGAMAASVAVLTGLLAFGPTIFADLSELVRHCMGQAHLLGRGELGPTLARAARTLALAAGPLALAAALAATGACIAEAGLHFKFELKWARMEPLGKLRQMVSPKTAAVNTLLPLLRVAVVAAVAHNVTEKAFPGLVRLTRAPLTGSVGALVDVVTRLAVWSTVALAVLSAVDYLNAWWRHEREIRMSRQELKEELRDQEGNPRIKTRQRALARELLRRGIRKEVKTADVVLVNPTHVSVALRYRPEEGAPVVAAKGYDDVALFIRELAKEHAIPIVENKPLARVLAERVRAGRAIPVDLYAAVAEVLAFVYRLKNRGLRA